MAVAAGILALLALVLVLLGFFAALPLWIPVLVLAIAVVIQSLPALRSIFK